MLHPSIHPSKKKTTIKQRMWQSAAWDHQKLQRQRQASILQLLSCLGNQSIRRSLRPYKSYSLSAAPSRNIHFCSPQKDVAATSLDVHIRTTFQVQKFLEKRAFHTPCTHFRSLHRSCALSTMVTCSLYSACTTVHATEL